MVCIKMNASNMCVNGDNVCFHMRLSVNFAHFMRHHLFYWTECYSIKKTGGGENYLWLPQTILGFSHPLDIKGIFLTPSDTKQNFLPPLGHVFFLWTQESFSPILPPSDSFSCRLYPLGQFFCQFYPPRTAFLPIFLPSCSLFWQFYPPQTFFWQFYPPRHFFLNILALLWGIYVEGGAHY